MEGRRGAGGSAEVFGGPGTTFSFLGRDGVGAGVPLAARRLSAGPPVTGKGGERERRSREPPAPPRERKAGLWSAPLADPPRSRRTRRRGRDPGALGAPLPLPVWPQQEADGWDRAGGGGRRSHGIRAAHGPPFPTGRARSTPAPKLRGERGRSHLSSSPLPWRAPPPSSLATVAIATGAPASAVWGFGNRY